MNFFDKVILINLILFVSFAVIDGGIFDGAAGKLAAEVKLVELIINAWVMVSVWSIPLWLSVSVYNW